MNDAVNKIIDYYYILEGHSDYSWVHWSNSRKRFTEKSANAFFIGVMLDQGQRAERAWEGGRHIVDNYFNDGANFWNKISNTHHATLKKICQSGFNGNSYAISYSFNKFPQWLKAASHRMLNEYAGDPRNIWNVPSENVGKIYDRFLSFDGIGDALAKMAQFILVRSYGIAGGFDSRSKMSVKPDTLVRRVMFRTGISLSENIDSVVQSIDLLNLLSPADFDAAAWVIGREFCEKTNPKCNICPLTAQCSFATKA